MGKNILKGTLGGMGDLQFADCGGMGRIELNLRWDSKSVEACFITCASSTTRNQLPSTPLCQ